MAEETLTFHEGFQQKMLERVRKDYTAAKKHLEPFHIKCDEMYNLYHNVKDYTSLKAENKFPIPYIQKTIDQFTADMMDKLYYANRPCQCVGREGTDKLDAEAKQSMLEYQDEYLRMYNKMRLFVKSCAQYRMAVCQVDWWEDKNSEWDEVDMPQMEIDQNGVPRAKLNPMTGESIPSGEKQWQKLDYVTFMGAKPKYIKVTDFFFTQDKEEIDDEFPVMIRAFKSRKFFDAPYFINVDKLENVKSSGSGSEEDERESTRRRKLHYETLNVPPGRPFKYIEWQGPVNKKELYAELVLLREDIIEVEPGHLYMEIMTDDKGEEIDRKVIEIETDDEMCWAICGITNDELVNRLEPNPFGLYCPNIIVGYMLSEDEGLTGALSLAELIEAVHRAMQSNMGMWIENLKQSVDAGYVIKRDAVLNASTLQMNKAGFNIETNQDVDKVYKRVEQPRVSPDIMIFHQILEQTGQDAIGRDEIVTGKGDPATQTLGESNMVFQQALLRTRDYLKTFEDSFIIPLWRMRTAINSEFITQDYAVRVLGEKGYEWRKISAAQVKSAVDFICESSKREQQKAILAQQIMEVAKIAPLAIQAGQPVRIDVLLDELTETCFSWVEQRRHRFLPLIAYEKEIGSPAMNKMLAENAFLQNAMLRISMISAAGNALVGTPGGNGDRKGGVAGATAKPKTESEAIENANQKSQPQVRQT
jgi:hypothetical protein